MKETDIFSADTGFSIDLPFADEGVRAGFPSPAQDYMENSIDLNRDLVKHPECTFYARVKGDSMIEAGVLEGDILVVDRSLEVSNGDMALCVLNGEFTVKFFYLSGERVELRPANSNYSPIYVDQGDTFEVWGVVTFVIHKMK